MAISDIQWATDTNFTNGPDVGTPTKVEPSAGVKAEGHVPGTILPAQRLNWHLNRLGEEASYVDDVLNADVNHYTKSGKLRQAWFMATTLQRGISSAGAPQWGLTTELRSEVNQALLFFDLRRAAPHGATLVNVIAVWKPGVARAGADRMLLELKERTIDPSPFPAIVGAVSTPFSIYDAGSHTDIEATTLVTTSYVIDSSKQQWVSITAGSDAGTNKDLFYGLRVTFQDPGPRNF